MRSTSFCRGILLLSGFRTVGSAKIKRLSTVNGPLSSYFASPIACKSKYDATTVDKIIKYMRGNAPPVETEPCFGIDSSISKTGLCLGDLTLQFQACSTLKYKNQGVSSGSLLKIIMLYPLMLTPFHSATYPAILHRSPSPHSRVVELRPHSADHSPHMRPYGEYSDIGVIVSDLQ